MNPDLLVTKLTSAVYEPCFFPCSLASVCSYWEEVLSAGPNYWTVLRVILKDGFAEPIKCRKHLSYSRDLPIDVFLIRDASQDDDTVSQVVEKMAVPGCMKALVPHLHRCRTLYADLTYGSSLRLTQRGMGRTLEIGLLLASQRRGDGHRQSVIIHLHLMDLGQRNALV